MAKLVSHFLSTRRQRFIGILVGCLVLLLLCVGALTLTSHAVHEAMASRSAEALGPYREMEGHLVTAFDRLGTTVTSTPCSEEYFSQLKPVALLPDGLNDFLHIRGNTVLCSSSGGVLAEPVDLGAPDLSIVSSGLEGELWVDRALDRLGHAGLKASIVRQKNFAVVIPMREEARKESSWLAVETIFASGPEASWHQMGREGIYAATIHGETTFGTALGLRPRHLECLGNGYVCVATEASLPSILWEQKGYALAFLTLAVCFATGAGFQSRSALAHYLSFEARFRRNLTAESVECLYQPIMDLRTGEIVACEVLARWRDVDDRIVYPDRFIPLVEKYGLTMPFTRMVVERAFQDLSRALPADRRLRVTFNLFPRDLMNSSLVETFSAFDGTRDRFELVAELVESDAIDVRQMQCQIDRLKEAGIMTYIDDFGTGYSSIDNVVDLAVDGVKIDRAFAMAPNGSVKSRMLDLAIEVVHATGKTLVVEGIETEERLRHLRSLKPAVEYVQGYHISRPVEIGAFAAFLAGFDMAEEQEREIVAAA